MPSVRITYHEVDIPPNGSVVIDVPDGEVLAVIDSCIAGNATISYITYGAVSGTLLVSPESIGIPEEPSEPKEITP